MATARETFVLADPKTFTPVVIRAGEKIPDWALDQVTHPDILGDGTEPATIAEHHEPEDADTATEGTGDETDDFEEDSEIDESQDFTLEDEGDKPDSTWLKADIADYLIERGVSVSGGETKDELLELIEQGE